jgi:hypothetical protein
MRRMLLLAAALTLPLLTACTVTTVHRPAPPPPAPPPAPAAALDAANPLGQPAFGPGSPMAYWIWADPSGIWHLRVTTARAPHTFHGAVTVEGGTLAGVRTTRPDWGDLVRLSGRRQIQFRFMTQGGMDGFDFRATSPVVRFDLYIDGRPMPRSVFVGAAMARPAASPFALQLARPAPPPLPPPPPPAPTPPPPPPPAPVANPIYGRPPFTANSPMAYWIWASPNGTWHVRTTTARAPHMFHGKVTTTGGRLTGVRATRVEWNDVVRVRRPNQIDFNLKVQGGTDGFDFRATTPCVRFHLLIDGRSRPRSVFMGANLARPAGIPFEVCR